MTDEPRRLHVDAGAPDGPDLDGLNPGQRVRALARTPGRIRRQLGALLGVETEGLGLPDVLPPTPYRAIVMPPGVRPVAAGPFGSAWRGSLPRFGPGNPRAANLTVILCDLPGYLNRWWRHYALFVIHLRTIEGTPPPVREGDDRTHELMVYALDPEPPPDPRDMRTWRTATKQTFQRAIERDRAPGNRMTFDYPGFSPARAGGQFVLPSDAAAVRLADAVAGDLCTGDLTPERADYPGGLAGWRGHVARLAADVGP
jgi:hypothetical protein